MAQCQGTTRSGNRCKLDAQPDSDYCHLHGAANEAPPKGGPAAEDTFEFEDLVPLLAAGAVAVGFFVLVKAFGRWIPRL